MEVQLRVIHNEYYRILAEIRQIRRLSRVDTSGNVTKLLVRLSNIVYQSQDTSATTIDYTQIDPLVQLLKSSDSLSVSLWRISLSSLSNILVQSKSNSVIDKAYTSLLTIDLLAYEYKCEGFAIEFLNVLYQILTCESAEGLTIQAKTNTFFKLFQLSIQNRDPSIRHYALSSLSRFIAAFNTFDFQIFLFFASIINLDWIARIRNLPNNERMHIISLDVLTQVEISNFDYFCVIEKYTNNVKRLAIFAKNYVATIPTTSFLEYISEVLVSSLSALNHLLEIFINTSKKKENLDFSAKYVLKNYVSYGLFISLLWENETILQASLRSLFNLYTIFGNEIINQLEVILSQLFSNPLNSCKEFNSFLACILFRSLPMFDIYRSLDAKPFRHNTFQAIIKSLLSNYIIDVKLPIPSKNQSKRKGGLYTRTKSKEKSLTIEEVDYAAESVVTCNISHILSSLFLLLSNNFNLNTLKIDDSTDISNKYQMEVLVDKFNNGGDWFSAFGDDEKQIVNFLNLPFLNLKLVGELLGSNSNPDLMDRVRKEFASRFNFTAMPITVALRHFLSTFRLPGESQQIERIIDSFSEVYFHDQLINPNIYKSEDSSSINSRWVVTENIYYDTFKDKSFLSALTAYYAKISDEDATPDAAREIFSQYVWRKSLNSGSGTWFMNPDAVFVLSYSIIMLNTDLHNSQIKNKMKIEEFINNNRGINGGTDLSEVFLRDVFNSISKMQITLDSDFIGLIQPTRESFSDKYTNKKFDLANIFGFQYKHYWNSIIYKPHLYNIKLSKLDNIDSELLSKEVNNKNIVNGYFDVLVSGGLIEFIDNAIHHSDSAEFLQEILIFVWKISVIAYKLKSYELINDIFNLSSLSFTNTLSHRCQIIISFSLHYIVSFGKIFNSKSWNLAVSLVVSLFSLGLVPFKNFGIAFDKPLYENQFKRLTPPMTRFPKFESKKQGFKWISDFTGYFFYGKHTSPNMLNNNNKNDAKMYFLFSPQYLLKDTFEELVLNPLFDPLLDPSKINLIKTPSEEQYLRQILDHFGYDHKDILNGSNVPADIKEEEINFVPSESDFVSIPNVSSLNEALLPNLLEYIKFKLALANYFQIDLLISFTLLSEDSSLNAFHLALEELKSWVNEEKIQIITPISTATSTSSRSTQTSSRKSEREEEEETERCKRGFILATFDLEIDKFKNIASPVIALGLIKTLITSTEKFEPTELVLKKFHSSFSTFVNAIDGNVWINESETENVKFSIFCIFMDLFSFIFENNNLDGPAWRDENRGFVVKMLEILSQVDIKYLCYQRHFIALEKALVVLTSAVSSKPELFLPTLLLIEKLSGVDDIKNDIQNKLWELFESHIANSKFMDGEHKDYLPDVIQTILLIAFKNEEETDETTGFSKQVQAVRLLGALDNEDVWIGCKNLVIRALTIAAAFSPRPARIEAVSILQRYICRVTPSVNATLKEFINVFEGVLIPLVTYKWDYPSIYTLNGFNLPLFHDKVAPHFTWEYALDHLTKDELVIRIENSFSSLCQIFMASLQLLLNKEEEVERHEEGCVEYLLNMLQRVILSLAQPANEILNNENSETFVETFKNFILVILYADEIKNAPETCIKHITDFAPLESFVDAAGITDKFGESTHYHKIVLATVANAIDKDSKLKDVFINTLKISLPE